jgi:hypothetical protein
MLELLLAELTLDHFVFLVVDELDLFVERQKRFRVAFFFLQPVILTDFRPEDGS